MSGAPVFVRSRVPLQTFFDYLEGEDGLSEFINDFPYLESQAVRVLETVSPSFKKPGFFEKPGFWRMS